MRSLCQRLDLASASSSLPASSLSTRLEYPASNRVCHYSSPAIRSESPACKLPVETPLPERSPLLASSQLTRSESSASNRVSRWSSPATKLESRTNKLPVATPLPDRTLVALPQRRDRSPLPQGVTSADLESTLDVIACDVINSDDIDVDFESVGGLEGIKQALYELVILPLWRPELFARGKLLHPQKGVLLYGLPGTGKTMLAKAIVIESKVVFINVRISNLMSKWFGDVQKLDFEVADDVKLEEMMMDDNEEFSELFYQCRCGDYILIDSEELGEIGFFLERNGGKELQTISGMPASVVLPCGSYSLKIRLILDSNHR
ncbi:hypothetical protein ACLOJK_037056 [Asimina triloba]